jgi:hypothetical protein
MKNTDWCTHAPTKRMDGKHEWKIFFDQRIRSTHSIQPNKIWDVLRNFSPSYLKFAFFVKKNGL